MKNFAIVSALVSVAAAQQLGAMDLDAGKTREQVGHILTPGGTAPLVQQLTPRFPNYHTTVKRTKVRYGPYRLPSTAETTLMSALTGEAGTMTSIATAMTKPCAPCGLVAAQAGLEYANGSVADNSNGAWLHHVVLITGGAGHSDGTCPGQGVGLIGERTFSSGNERTLTAFGDILNNKVKSVFPVAPADVFSAQLELMNLNTVVKNVYLTIDFDWIPGTAPPGFKRARAMWLDVTNCGISSVNPPYGKMNFKLNSKRWTVGYTGQMLGVGGHLHDGGTVLNIYKNDQVVCVSKANYGMGGGHSHGRRTIDKRQGANPTAADGKEHIKEMSTCSMLGAVSPNDQIWIDAQYDFNKHKGFQSKSGSFTEVMGIAIMYLAADK